MEGIIFCGICGKAYSIVVIQRNEYKTRVVQTCCGFKIGGPVPVF